MALNRQRNAANASNDSECIDGVSDPKYESSIVSYYGTDQHANFLFMKIHRRAHDPDELVVFLRLEDECTYELPDHPNTVVSVVGNSTWSAAGLKISVLQSSRRTRILFNGLLRKGNRQDIHDNLDDNDVQHVRLNCIFIASTKPYLQNEYWSPHLLSETLKHNCWKKSKWQQYLKNLNIDQADQYGSIMAQVTFEDSSSKQLYLRGMRQSQWGRFDATYFDENICITASDTLGISFHVRCSDIRDGVKKSVRLGHVKDPEHNLHSIESLSFDANRLMKLYDSGLDDFEFQFSAGKRKYAAAVKLRRDTLRILYGGVPWDSQYTYCQFELMLDNAPGVGMIQIWRPHLGLCPINLISAPRKFIKLAESIDDEQVYVLLFEDGRCRAGSLVGGKGASLAELTAIKDAKFTVPKGFCVTVNALNEHINRNKWLMNRIDELAEIFYQGNAEAIEKQIEKSTTGFRNTPITRSVISAIWQTLDEFEWENGESKYAVRSSSLVEDGEDMSAAGQNATFLGVASGGVAGSVAHCWASMYTNRSIQSRRQHGLPIKASMGVCVQQMVDAEAAGVMFTRHPITGNPKEIVITSNYGLGESVVSALADPDTIIIHRDQKDLLSVKSTIIGKKLQKITINSRSSGTIHSDVSANERSKLSISEEIAVKLAEIGVAFDQLYNAPRDIEWAVSKGQIYLLHCRPVTALDAWTDFELAHELGSGVPSDSEILTLANMGEALLMVATPLTISTVVHGLNVSTEGSYSRCRVNDTYKQHIFVVNNKCFLNYATSFLRHASDQISLSSKLAEIAVCGHTINTPEINAMGLRRNGGPLTRRQGLRLLGKKIVDIFYKSRMIEEAEQIVKHCRTTSSDDLYERLGELMGEYLRLSTIYIHTTKCSVSFQVFVLSILAEGNDELPMEHYSDVALLLGACDGVVSAQVPLALTEITRIIKENGLSDEFKIIDPSKALSWLLTNCPIAHERVQKFIEVHGHRGIDEFELVTETWGMRPEQFLSTVQLMLNSSTENTSTKTIKLSPRETVALLKTPQKSSTRWLISMLLSSMRNTVSEREQTKCLLIELVHLMRMGYRNLSEILVREGRLPERELIFFFTHEELAKIIRTPCPEFVRKAARRRRLRPSLQRYQYSEISHGLPKPIEVSKVPSSSGGARIQGTPVCNGMATGRACVALSLEEAAAIRPGDILVTRATDIGWSPYFPLLAGIVTELGGLISHGAVVAREYGLPCIVGVENATATFKTGDSVKLDGYAGIIEAVEDIYYRCRGVIADDFF